jgi:hypothetical protein
MYAKFAVDLVSGERRHVFDDTCRTTTDRCSVGFLGPTSTWAFCRRALFVLGTHSPGSIGNSAGVNCDGTAFRLRWETKPSVEHSDLSNLPAADYARYLYDSVKFRLGELFAIVDEAHFMSQFERFQRDQWQIACTQRLWFVEYLLILAYGKALLSHPDRSPVPGSDFAARAMALLPDAAQLHEEGAPAIEVLALVALYFQSIDMRVTAYQYVSSGPSFMPPQRHTSTLDDALMLRVRLSRLIATTCTSRLC